jgi:hypothetical protein
LEQGGKEAIITSFEQLEEAVVGRAGTRVVPARKAVAVEEVEVLSCR